MAWCASAITFYTLRAIASHSYIYIQRLNAYAMTLCGVHDNMHVHATTVTHTCLPTIPPPPHIYIYIYILIVFTHLCTKLHINKWSPISVLKTSIDCNLYRMFGWALSSTPLAILLLPLFILNHSRNLISHMGYKTRHLCRLIILATRLDNCKTYSWRVAGSYLLFK